MGMSKEEMERRPNGVLPDGYLIIVYTAIGGRVTDLIPRSSPVRLSFHVCITGHFLFPNFITILVWHLLVHRGGHSRANEQTWKREPRA